MFPSSEASHVDQRSDSPQSRISSWPSSGSIGRNTLGFNLSASQGPTGHQADLAQILHQLHISCTPTEGASSSDDQTKGSLLLELYAIEIQMYTDMKEYRKQKVASVTGGRLAADCIRTLISLRRRSRMPFHILV